MIGATSSIFSMQYRSLIKDEEIHLILIRQSEDGVTMVTPYIINNAYAKSKPVTVATGFSLAVYRLTILIDILTVVRYNQSNNC